LEVFLATGESRAKKAFAFEAAQLFGEIGRIDRETLG
jgi:hypothetical protein